MAIAGGYFSGLGWVIDDSGYFLVEVLLDDGDVWLQFGIITYEVFHFLEEMGHNLPTC